MSQSASPSMTLDLHGKLVVDAISEVTLFLERIRRTRVDSSTGMSEGRDIFFVRIITGSGSHSPHGPVLRSAIQKLLEKRCMDWTLECGGGCFQVDALSGHDLYDPAPATNSKVLLADVDEFHQLAAARRSYAAGSYAGIAQGGHCTVPQCVAGAPLSRKSSSENLSDRHSSDYPLPMEVALEDKDVQTATELSVIESQRHKNKCDGILKQSESDFQRALSESKLDSAVVDDNRTVSNVDEESLLKFSSEQYFMDEQRRQERAEKEFEEALRLAMDLSTDETMKQTSAEDDFERALVESRALSNAEKAACSIDDLVEKALAESILLEETRKVYIHEHEKLAASRGIDLLEEVKQLSLKQHQEDVLSEEEALREAIEKSKHVH